MNELMDPIDHGPSRAYVRGGDTLLREGKLAEARELFERALASEGADAGAIYAQLATIAIALGDHVAAAHDLSRARSLGAPQPSLEAKLRTECVVHEAGAWFEAAARIELADRPVLKRLLGVLIERRVRCPGALVSAAELAHALYPLEDPDEAGARLRANLSRLRRLGLGPFLVRRRGGYALSTAVRVCKQGDDAAFSPRA
jgi:tetratricopeptide (TPR) repeat protein